MEISNEFYDSTNLFFFSGTTIYGSPENVLVYPLQMLQVDDGPS